METNEYLKEICTCYRPYPEIPCYGCTCKKHHSNGEDLWETMQTEDKLNILRTAIESILNRLDDHKL